MSHVNITSFQRTHAQHASRWNAIGYFQNDCCNCQCCCLVYLGLSGALVSAVSLVVVGWAVKKLKLQTRGACALLILSICGSQLSITAMLPWECDQALLAGAQAARYDDSAL